MQGEDDAAVALYQAGNVAAPPSGTPFVMRIDVLSGPGGFGQGQALQVIVGQGGSLYQTPAGVTGFPHNSWTTIAFNGAFMAASFTKISGPGPPTPSFDGVTPTSFGFAVGNSMSATLTQYYDNWNITFAPGPAAEVVIPTLSNGAVLLLAALVALGAIAPRRRRS